MQEVARAVSPGGFACVCALETMEYRIAGINATRLGISLMTVVRDPLQAAVRRTSVPPRLREQIQSAIRREAVRQARQRVFLAVAACAIAALAGSIGVQSFRLAPVLQVGLNDHLKCAAPRILPTHGPAIDTLSTEVGRDFAAPYRSSRRTSRPIISSP